MRKGNLKVSMVKAICRMIKGVVIPLIAANHDRTKKERRAVLDAITLEMLQGFAEA